MNCGGKRETRAMTVSARGDALEVSQFFGKAQCDDITQAVPKLGARENDVEVDVRTNVWCSWFEVEIIGTLQGKNADIAARLAVQQVHFHRNGVEEAYQEANGVGVLSLQGVVAAAVDPETPTRFRSLSNSS